MTSKKARYLIGIDLGTTNTVVAYADLHKPVWPDNCQVFEIEQLVAAGEVAKRPMLPSFRYHPARGELSPADLTLPWSEKVSGELDQVVVGEWARELGSKVGGRQVVSAKSWLSHPQVDRTANILPWTGSEEVEKVSPILASSSYLHHVRCAWNCAFPDSAMEHQDVVITVPASFDEGARSLTVEAAKRAGLNHIFLLEEPQAVCYDWYAREGEQAQSALQNIKLLLVCDVGGGTTDLSLIKISHDKNNQLSLTRIGVGNHLMLGGDNVDLSLAHKVENDLSKNGKATRKLSAASLSQLIQQTRKAKELLLGENAPDTAKVTLLGSGSSLIGGAKSTNLTKEEVHSMALDGFFPIIPFETRPSIRKSGVVEFGLAYAPDPAVSKYLAEFIADHQLVCKDALGLSNTSHTAIPDAVLFNGGVFNSPIVNERALNVLSQWRSESLHQLENDTPDLAVAKGAVAYAKARRGEQLKIGGGSARSFFLMLDQKEGSKSAICIMPKGTEEEQELPLKEQVFSLKLGQPVQFHLVSCSSERNYQAGEIIDFEDQLIASKQFISLPPLVVALQQGDDKSIQVSLVSCLSAVGTLQVNCVASNEKRWRLEFEIRKPVAKDSKSTHEESLPSEFNLAVTKIEDVYGHAKKEVNPKAVKNLKFDLEKRLGKREKWQGNVLRGVFDQLFEKRKRRRRSANHERVWFNMAGYGIRPGYGFPADDWRLEQVWNLYSQGLQFGQEAQGWIDWWTFWRRAAGGLSAQQQLKIYQDVAKYIKPSALTNKKLQNEAKLKSYENMVKLVATLEHLPVESKSELAQQLLKRLEKPSETVSSWWAVGRIASRVPFYGSTHNVIDKDTIQSWLPKLLKLDWKKHPQCAFATVLMVRMSGDRSRDVDSDWRIQVLEKLIEVKSPKSWIQMVEAVKELDEAETKQVFGEGLPIGLTLL